LVNRQKVAHRCQCLQPHFSSFVLTLHSLCSHHLCH
uniref:Ovule protein n=1 Tax=Haemonchus placei TaxID=6290 RepID=A0A0N4WN70_HAEPC